MNGTTALRQLNAFRYIRDGIEAVRLGARDFPEKPLDFKVLLRLVRAIVHQRQPMLHPLVKAMDDYPLEHAAEQDMRVARLANHFEVSIAYVRRLFRDHVGQPLRRRLMYHRVHLAKRMINTSRDSLQAIAARAGFDYQNRLTESFRRMEGMTPSQYRKYVARGRSERKTAGSLPEDGPSSPGERLRGNA